MTQQFQQRVYCAIDTTDLPAAKSIAAGLVGSVGGIKLGMEFFYAHGNDGLRAIKDVCDLPIFLDVKIHDIPNTAKGALRGLIPAGPKYITLHASGGMEMMQAAAYEAADGAARMGVERPKLLGVTMLTSLDQQNLKAQHIEGTPADHALRMATLAQKAGLDGVVASGHELKDIRTRMGDDFVIAVPGIRPTIEQKDDQKRVITPQQAIDDGADVLVIGRAITQAANPAQAVREMFTNTLA